MAGEYEKAIHQIVNRRYLLPAIQRKFTWSSSQICVLFDSIMRGYPINTFMFWEVREPEVKKSFRFYQFLERYCERFEENNPDFDTSEEIEVAVQEIRLIFPSRFFILGFSVKIK